MLACSFHFFMNPFFTLSFSLCVFISRDPPYTMNAQRARALEAAAAEAAAAHAEEVKGLKQAHEGLMAATRERQEAELRALREERDKAVGSLQVGKGSIDGYVMVLSRMSHLYASPLSLCSL